MATNIGGKYSNFEKNFAAQIGSLTKSVTFRTNRITSILLRAYDNPTAKAGYWNDIRRDINTQYKQLNSLYANWAKVNIPQAYRYSTKEIMTTLNRSKAVSKLAKKTFSDIVTSPATLNYTSHLYKDAIADWTNSTTLGQANLNRLTRKTQQTLLKESFIDSSVAKAFESGNLMNNTYIKTMNMSNSLASVLDEVATVIDGKKYIIAGAKRFTPKYYAEMVTRTKFHEAQSASAMQTALNYGTSLVRVSNHNTKTQICQLYEGKIYSINGKDPRFPPLINSSPFHTNCIHNMFPMFEEGMEAMGTLDQWQDFSNGKIETPPGKTNFIPISERGE